MRTWQFRPELALSARAASEAAVMAAWDFREYKTQNADDAPAQAVDELVLIAANEREQQELNAAADLGVVLGRSANLARDLASRPGNIATPTYLAKTAQELGARHGMKVTVLGREETLARLKDAAG